MGLFDFLKKKKDDEFGDMGGDLGSGFGPEPGMPGTSLGGMPPPGIPGIGMGGPGAIPPARPGAVAGTPRAPALFGAPEAAPVGIPPPITPTSVNLGQMPMGAPTPGIDISSKLEVLNSKIDSLKVSIERVNDRLEFLERYLKGR